MGLQYAECSVRSDIEDVCSKMKITETCIDRVERAIHDQGVKFEEYKAATDTELENMSTNYNILKQSVQKLEKSCLVLSIGLGCAGVGIIALVAVLIQLI